MSHCHNCRRLLAALETFCNESCRNEWERIVNKEVVLPVSSLGPIESKKEPKHGWVPIDMAYYLIPGVRNVILND